MFCWLTLAPAPPNEPRPCPSWLCCCCGRVVFCRAFCKSMYTIQTRSQRQLPVCGATHSMEKGARCGHGTELSCCALLHLGLPQRLSNAQLDRAVHLSHAHGTEVGKERVQCRLRWPVRACLRLPNRLAAIGDASILCRTCKSLPCVWLPAKRC